MAKFFQMQCRHSQLSTIPHDFRHWINVRRIFGNRYAPTTNGLNRVNLAGMLTAFDMTFDGREHSGIDDARNIARIVIHMLNDRCLMRVK